MTTAIVCDHLIRDITTNDANEEERCPTFMHATANYRRCGSSFAALSPYCPFNYALRLVSVFRLHHA